MTINAAHKYLGLTTEVLRTERAINEIANHPLPNSFYEGGGLQRLRQRFDRSMGESPDPEMDYFSPDHSSPDLHAAGALDEPHVFESPARESPALFRAHSSRFLVQAGDLHTSTGSSESFRPFHRSFSFINGGHKKWDHNLISPIKKPEAHRLMTEDFDLRDEVMTCIAKSIGLHQPPLSGTESVEASPLVTAVDGIRNIGSAFSSLGSLSLLETGDDASSATGASSVTGSGHNIALDNEVEILYFTAGSTLARKGERHPGTYYPLMRACQL